MKTINKKRMTMAALAFMALTVCDYRSEPASVMRQNKADPIAEVEYSQWSETELHAIAKTLAGECYDDKELDKRRVCEVILNRVSDNNFANTILGVLTTPAAFHGYWRQSRPISKNDYAVAEQALRDWYAGGCKPLSQLLFFNKGPNRENVFRSGY